MTRQESTKPETSEGRVPVKKGIIGSMYSHIRGVAPGGEKDPLLQGKGGPQKISQMMGPQKRKRRRQMKRLSL